jgi:phospholipase C
VITYDEHGGCYDHVPPPWGAVPPDADAGEFGFGFDRFGIRVPTVLVSPLIAPGTVYRTPAGERRSTTRRSSRPSSSGGTCPR